MSYSFKLSRRISRLRLPVCVAFASLLAACNGDNTLDPNSVADAPAVPTIVGDDAGVDTLAITTDGATASAVSGIPFGNMAQPITVFSSLYNGGKITTGPANLRSELAAIKSRGGRVSPTTVDAMGQYSKHYWPGMATIIRAMPKYFKSNPHYVDAAWAQYVSWYGSPSSYVSQQVSDAKARGLALVLGMNVIDGGSPKHTPMSASEVKSYGAALLTNSYPCAFVSWQYRSTYFSTASIKDAMQYLRGKAGSHSFKSCKGS
jgi:hypothetical protein